MPNSPELLEDLLIQRSLEGLNDIESQELESLLKEFPEMDTAAFDRSVAAVTVANLPGSEAMPAHLCASIEAEGIRFVAARQAARALQSTSRPDNVTPIETAHRTAAATRGPRQTLIPWILAAASITFAAFTWWSLVATPPEVNYVEQRSALIDSGALIREWATTEDPVAAGASGDIVWDNVRQEGYMRFNMLTANDPDQYQYQLWIFDSERDERYPVDGGVFDVPAGSTEIIVPINPSIPVSNAILFAVTVERPGGVVVSSRERIALLAEIAQA